MPDIFDMVADKYDIQEETKQPWISVRKPKGYVEPQEEERPASAELATALKAGGIGYLENVLRAGRVLGLDTSDELESVKVLGEQYEPTRKGAMWESLFGGIQSTIESLTAGIPAAAAGTAVGGPVGAALGFSGGAGTLFSLAEFDRFIEEAESLGIPREDIIDKAIVSAVAEGGIEAAQDLIGAKIFNVIGRKAVSETAKRGLLSALQRFSGKMGKLAAVEVPGEMTTSSIQAQERLEAGIPTERPWEAAKGAIGPTLVQTGLMGPFASGSGRAIGREEVLGEVEKEAAEEAAVAEPEAPEKDIFDIVAEREGIVEEKEIPEPDIFDRVAEKEGIEEKIETEKPVTDLEMEKSIEGIVVPGEAPLAEAEAVKQTEEIFDEEVKVHLEDYNKYLKDKRYDELVEKHPKWTERDVQKMMKMEEGEIESKVTISNLKDQIRKDERLIKYLESELPRAERRAERLGKKEATERERARIKVLKARAAERKSMQREYSKMTSRLKKLDISKFSRPQKFAVTSLLKNIDLIRINKPTKLRLETTRKYLMDNPETEIPEYVLNRIDRLNKKNVTDLSFDDFKAIYDATMHHVHLEKTKRQLRVGKKKRDFAEAREAAISEMNPPKKIKDDLVESQKKKPLKKFGKLLVDTLGIRQDHHDLIIESLAGPNSLMDKVFFQDIKEGIIAQISYRQSITEAFKKHVGEFDKKFEIKNIDKWINEKVKTGKFNLTRNERMSLYRHSLNEDNRRSIVKSGLGLKYSDTPNKVFQVTEKELDAIIESMSDAEKFFSGNFLDKFYEDQYDALNKVFYEVNNYDLPKEDNYYRKEVMPIMRGKDIDKEENLLKFSDRMTRIGVPKGMLKERKRVSRALYLNPLTSELSRSIFNTSAYVGLEIPLRNASRLLYDKTFRATMEDRYGKRTWKEIEKGLRDIAGEHTTYDTVEDMLLKLKNNLSTAALGINPTVMLKQVVSLPVYMPYVKMEYLMEATLDNIWNSEKINERHLSYSPEYKERVDGGYSRDVADVFKSKAAKKIYSDRKELKESVMGGIKLFDQMAVSTGMHGAVLQVLDEFKSGKLSREVGIALDMKDSDISKLSAAEKMKLAYKYADYATERTQPMFSPEHRSSLSRGTPIEKLFTMFGSFTNQALNLVRRSYRDALRTGDPQAYTKLAKSLFVVFFINSMAVIGIDRLRDYFYGRKPKRLIPAILDTWAGYMFFVRDLSKSVISKVERGPFLGYDIEIPISRYPELFANVLANGTVALTDRNYRKRKKAAMAFVDDALTLTLMTMGIPYETPKKYIETISKMIGE